ncbi:MAG: branched-chain amino acid transport system permease protein [Acidimicrobiaceae bacterium]
MDWDLIFRQGATAGVGPIACYTALAAIGLNMQFGYTGLLNFGQAAFAAMGAYGLAVSVATYGLSFWAGLGFGLFAAIVLAVLLGLPTLRLRADYLAIVTIAASEIVRLVVRSVRYTKTLGGTDGLQNFAGRFFEINPLSPGEHGVWLFKFNERDSWLLICGWGLVVFCSLITFLAIRSPWGRVIKAIREDEDAVRSLGKNTYWYKMQSLMLGGLFGAMSGFVFAMSKQSVNPDDYTTRFTFVALAVLILGGTARVMGPIVGAIIFTGVLQFIDTLLRQMITAGYIPDWLPLDTNKIGPVRLILTGLVIMLLMIYRPQGIFGDRNEVRISAR